jgi:ABC-2 type transport system ATP-binding protein
VLDEPTAGVDVELRRQLWELVSRMNAEGVTVVLTTHYLEEAEELCDRIAIINHGQLVACDSTQALLRRLDNKTVTLMLTQPLTQVPEPLRRFNPTQPTPTEIAIAYRPSTQAMTEILDAARACALPVGDIRTEEVDLEDIFLQLTRNVPPEHAAR